MPRNRTRSPIPQVPINHQPGLNRRQLKKGPANPRVGLRWWQHWPLITVLLLLAATIIIWWLVA